MATNKPKSKSAKTARKSSRKPANAGQAQRPCSQAVSCGQCRRLEGGFLQIDAFVVQAVDRAQDAARAKGRDDRRHHEGNRLAAAFGARLLRRRGQEEAQAESRLGKGWRPAHLSDRQSGRGFVMPSAATSETGSRSSRRGRAGSAAHDADRGVAEAIPRTIPGRSAEGVRPGPAPAQHRAPDPGEGLWRPLPHRPAAARSAGQGMR